MFLLVRVSFGAVYLISWSIFLHVIMSVIISSGVAWMMSVCSFWVVFGAPYGVSLRGPRALYLYLSYVIGGLFWHICYMHAICKYLFI